MEEDQNTPRWEQKLVSYGKALRSFDRIVKILAERELDEFEQDSLVHRFGYTHESAWKTIKSFAEYSGETRVLMGSRDVTRWALEKEIISDGEVWMSMIRTCNELAHVYDEEMAKNALQEAALRYYPLMVNLWQTLKDKSSDPNLFSL